MNKLRDFFYNISDLIMAIVVITLVVCIISWKINAIAAYPEYAASLPSNSNDIDEKDTNDVTTPSDSESESDTEPEKTEPDEDDEVTDPVVDPVPTNPELPDPNVEPEPTNPEPETPSTPKILTIKIPEGSLGSSIAKILLQNNLIDSSSEFLNRASERKLDEKLRSGTFKIPSNATLDEVVNILTGQK